MATTTLLRSLRRDISSAPLSAFKSLSGATTKVTGTYLSYGFGVISRPFWKPIGSEVNNIIAIDLGTSNSSVAVREGKTGKIISTPSVVAFNDKGEVTIGAQAITNTKNNVFGVKRLLGRRFDDIETQKEMKMVPYNIVKAVNGDAWIEANGRMYSPSLIAAFIFAQLKKDAEDYLGKAVHETDITVPGCFNDAQKKATIDAARIAGLKVKSIYNETTVAALVYAYNNRDGLIDVVDLGGGTFDVSIFNVAESDPSYKLEIRAENGDSSLGGKDFDEAIVDFWTSELKRTDGIDVTDDIFALQSLREAAEKAKIALSTKTQIDIRLLFTTTNADDAKHLNITLTRPEFEAQVNHLMKRIESLCKKCIKDSGITTSELKQVCLVGDMTRVPIVKQVVTEIFGKTPVNLMDTDEVVRAAYK